jgi:hypothetical protein
MKIIIVENRMRFLEESSSEIFIIKITYVVTARFDSSSDNAVVYVKKCYIITENFVVSFIITTFAELKHNKQFT